MIIKKGGEKMQKRKISFASFYQKHGVIVLLIVIFLLASILNKNFLQINNLRNILRQIVIITIIACGGCYVLVCAQINIAYDGLIACLGCISCLIMVMTQNVYIAVILTLILGALIGLLYGTCVTVLNVPGFLVGLAISSISSGAIMLLTKGTKVTGMDASFMVLGKGSIGPIPINVIVTVLCMLVCHVLLTKTTFGRKVFAVGGNRKAAIASGINADSIIRRVYMLDGITTALAAILFMSRLGSGQPNAGSGYAFSAITGAVVGGCSISGGKGSVLNCLVGASIVGILNNILSLMNVSSYWQSIFSGSIILLAVLIDVASKQAATTASTKMMDLKRK